MSLFSAMIQTYHADHMSREKLRQTAEKRLNALVTYARTYSPYYKSLYSHIGSSFCLEDLPPTDKPSLMADTDNVLPDRSITAGRIERFTEAW